MSLRDADRGQAVQIGTILIFGVLIILFATYQAFVVPNQNRQVEANHAEAVAAQMDDLRNAIVSRSSVHSDTAVALRLGPTYPARLVAVNPGPPSNAIRTLGTQSRAVNLSVANARATDGETDDFWTGDPVRFNTGAIAFQPGYNLYRNAPTIVYENSLLYHRFDTANLTQAGQQLVDGRTISLTTLNGSLDRSQSGGISVDVDAISASSRRISITNDSSDPIEIAFASQYNATQWEAELSADGEYGTDENVTSVSDSPIPNSDFHRVTLELAQNGPYTLKLTKVGVGNGIEREGRRYLVDVQGNASSLEEESSAALVLEVRDKFNNPLPGVEVFGRLESAPQRGELSDRSVVTDENGQAVFRYRADEIDGVSSREFAVDFSYTTDPVSGVNGDAPENVTMSVEVQNTDGSGLGVGPGSGTYDVAWTDPSTETQNSGAAFEGCSDESCTWNVADSAGSTLHLDSEISQVFEGVDLEYAVSNTSVATVSPETNETTADGTASTTLTAQADGTVDVLVSGDDGSDVITIEVTNVSQGPVPTISTRLDDLTDQNTNSPEYIASYEVANTNASFERVEVFFDNPGGTNELHSSSTTRGGFRYEDGSGAGSTFEVRFDVVYTDSSGDEYVAASTTVTDEADAVNPNGNEDLSTSGSAQFTSWSIDDHSQTNQNRPRYWFDYDVSATGSFSEVVMHALNLPGGGARGLATEIQRSANNVDLDLNYGANEQYRVGLLVRDADGAVVDVASITDVADGSGSFSGP